jgi:hypothetical protein
VRENAELAQLTEKAKGNPRTSFDDGCHALAPKGMSMRTLELNLPSTITQRQRRCIIQPRVDRRRDLPWVTIPRRQNQPCRGCISPEPTPTASPGCRPQRLPGRRSRKRLGATGILPVRNAEIVCMPFGLQEAWSRGWLAGCS